MRQQTYLYSYLNGEDRNVHGEDNGLSSDLNGEDRNVYREDDERRVAVEAERRFEREEMGFGFTFWAKNEEERQWMVLPPSMNDQQRQRTGCGDLNSKETRL